MLKKTQGIVLNYFKYRENSLIAAIFTEKLGYLSFIVHSAFSAKNPKVALFQPLNILDLVIHYKNTKNLQRIDQAALHFVYHSIPNSPSKSFLLLFLQEIFTYILREEKIANPVLFAFVTEKMRELERTTASVANFHIQVLLELSQYLGFDIRYNAELLTNFSSLGLPIDSSRAAWDFSKMTSQNRKLILENILQEYQKHYSAFCFIHSLPILQAIAK